MPDIRPFPGVLYDEKTAGSISALVAPPYDVIPPEMQAALQSRSPYNIAHVSLAPSEGSGGGGDRYARAAEALDEWLRTGVLRRDDVAALYVYQQTFQVAALGWRTRTGVLAAVRLVPWGQGVHPHERTIPSHKEDRLKLMRATHCNVSPIFALYSDEAMEVEADWQPVLTSSPVFEFTDEVGVTHRLWRLSGADAVGRICTGLSGRDIFIADGHHRYETALAFRDEIAAERGGLPDDSPYNYVMMYLTNMDHPEGLVILPAHRVISGVDEARWRAFDERVGEAFEVETFPLTSETEMSCAHRVAGRMAELARVSHTFALYRGQDDIRLFRLRDRSPLARLREAGRIENSVDLDVPILHTLLLEEYLDFHPRNDGPGCNIRYVVEADEAMRLVDSGEASAVFLLNPTTVEQVRQVAMRGEKMPGKATYFYPKLLTGLVLRLLR